MNQILCPINRGAIQNQWAGILVGDESYAGSKSWTKMEKTVKDLTGYEYVLPTHQGRAAERILYGYLGGKGKTFISNTHVDTTRANIENSSTTALDIPIKEGLSPSEKHPFKGNMDINKLKKIIIEKKPENIGAVILTITNITGGGQPASINNTKDINKICKKYNIPFMLDCCRIAENSYFIKKREKGFENYSYKEIANEMFSFADGAIMSAKKDGLVNMGGFIALNNSVLAEACNNQLIISEGFTTYGGLSGRDMEAIAIGLNEVFDEHYLEYRIKSTLFLGEQLHKIGIPLLYPIGGHAVYIDAKKLYSHIPVKHFPGQALVCELFKVGGIRTV